MAETVGQHSVAAFTSPVNGTSPIDANTVKGNDNTIRSAYVDHDADPGIHVQSSTLASRPVANSAGRKWMTQDSGVIRLFYDDGTSWYEVDYLRTTGGTISGNLAITGTLAVTGVATFTAQPILSSLTASRAVFTDGSKGLVSNAITGTGDVVMSASPTLTGTITAASATLSGTLGVSGLLTFASLKGTGATTVTNILDEDNMASDSATALATQQSIKAYVDAQVGASDALSEVLAIGNTTGANDIIVSAGQKIRTPAVAAQDGSSAITIANTTGALTLATALADSNLATISTAGKVSNSATTATSANTASAIVARDASGNFTAGTITAALTGNASTATTLQTARNINGVSFNGSADITVTAAAGTLTGTTLASNVTASSLTSVGTLANLTVTNPITGSVTGSSGSTTGNAATATALQTARNINGVSFNGTADITVTAAAGTLTGTTLASGVTASSLTSVGTLSSLTVSGDLTVDTNTLKVDSTNNRVGIGTASPGTGYRLHIVDSGNTVGTNTPLFLSSANGVATTSYGWDNLTSSYDYTIKVNGSTTAMTISNTGNLAVDTNTLYVDAANNRVGVGTASPATNLHLLGVASANTDFTHETVSAGTAARTRYLRGGSVKFLAGLGAYTGGDTYEIAGPSAVFATIDASGNLAVDTNTLYVDAANNRVGVGTATPGAPLDSVSDSSAIGLKVRGRSSDNFGLIQFTANNGTTDYAYLGTPTANTLAFYTNGFTERMRLDASGNLGLGVTPSAWGTAKALQVGTYGALSSAGAVGVDTQLSNNAYYDGTNWRYIASQEAFRFQMNRNTCAWFIAPSGIAGNAITFTQAMTLDASGNLGLGETSPTGIGSSYRNLVLKGTSGSNVDFNDASGTVRGSISTDNSGGNAMFIDTRTSHPIVFRTNTTERARIDASGNLGVGTTSPGYRLDVSGDIRAVTTGTTRYIIAGSDTQGAVFQQRAQASWGDAFQVYRAGNLKWALQEGSDAFIVSVNSAERARITAAGELFIGATAASGASRLVVAGSGASGRLAKFLGNTAGDLSNASVLFSKFDNNSTTSQVFLQFAVNNDSIANGQINANGSGAAAFGSWSDVRLKNNVVDLSSQWDNVKALRPVEFDYIEEAGGGHQIGFIAQEVKEIYPDVVGERADGMLTLSGMSKNEARLIKALQEAMARIESLEARLAALES